MKALKVYFGYNSQGAMTEIAESINHTFYKRTYGFNGYGTGFSKWVLMDYEPKLRDKVVNNYTLETDIIPVNERTQIECGFTHLTLMIGDNKVRLPKE